DHFSPESVAAVRKAYPAPLTSKNLISVAIRERRVVHEPDVLVSGGYSDLQRTSGYRSILVVPMLRDEDTAIARSSLQVAVSAGDEHIRLVHDAALADCDRDQVFAGQRGRVGLAHRGHRFRGEMI